MGARHWVTWSRGRIGIMRVELRKTFQFEAAHLLPHLPESHKCGDCMAIVSGGNRAPVECDPQLGWLMDYTDMNDALSRSGNNWTTIT